MAGFDGANSQEVKLQLPDLVLNTILPACLLKSTSGVICNGLTGSKSFRVHSMQTCSLHWFKCNAFNAQSSNMAEKFPIFHANVADDMLGWNAMKSRPAVSRRVGNVIDSFQGSCRKLSSLHAVYLHGIASLSGFVGLLPTT